MSIVKRALRRWVDTYIRRDPKRIAYYQYLDAGGESLRLDYPLGEGAVVIDAGGFYGDFAAEVLARFNCSRIDVFEPVQQYAEGIRKRFGEEGRVHVLSCGLGGTEREEEIHVAGIGSSVFDRGESNEERTEKIRIISVVDYLRERNYPVIDLFKINIEGGEYELLNTLLTQSDLLENIRFLQIQFHDFVPGACEMREAIREGLSKTHRLMWNFPFIWESWERFDD